jgi:hypothetical protein
MEDDEIRIADAIGYVSLSQRGDGLHGNSLPGQLVSQESVIDRAILDEKDANCARLTDGGEWRRCARIQAHRNLIESGSHLKSLPLDSLSDANWEGRLGETPGEQAVGCRHQGRC